MPENLGNKINQQENVAKNDQTFLSDELKGDENNISKEKRIKYLIDHLIEEVTKEPEENRILKLLELLKKYNIPATKEELETYMIVEEAIEQGKISKESEEKIEKIIKNDKTATGWIKKIILIGAILLAPFSGKKNNKQTTENEELKNKTNITNPKIDTENIKTYKNEKIFLKEQIPNDLEKPIGLFKNREIIQDKFYLLDKSNLKSPTVYEITKQGRVVTKDTVGIGREKGDQTAGYTTPAGIYMFTDYITEKDKKLYGENGGLKLLGYDINGDKINNLGIHIIYPKEKEERTEKMLDTASSKGISYRCINVFDKTFKEHILPNFIKVDKKAGKLFIFIMQEKNAFDEKRWEDIIQKMENDVKILE
ncbi:MAG: hypothetical protein WC264_03710 [Candidatus Paceibacterota bacterium]|jgi:hypothetical protein